MAAEPYLRHVVACPTCGSQDEYPTPRPSVHTCGHPTPLPGSLIPEDVYNAVAATAATRAEDLIRMAEDDGDAGDQIVFLIEEAAQEVASAAMRLRVASRRLALGNVPGADRAKLEKLAAEWERAREIGGVGPVPDWQARIMGLTMKACAIQLRHVLDGDDTDG